MKNWATILLLFSSTFLFAQNEISYGDVLKKTREINITDSVLLDVGSMEHNILDTITLKTFFPSLYPPLVTKKSRPVEYYISGKITTHPYFDVLFVTTKKETDDNHLFQSVYLMTTRKDGSNISTLAVAIKRENDAVVNTNSWMHKDYKVFVTTRIHSKGKDFGGLNEYRINEEGRFVHYPHWKN